MLVDSLSELILQTALLAQDADAAGTVAETVADTVAETVTETATVGDSPAGTETVAAGAEAPAGPTSGQIGLKLAIFVASIVVPLILGSLIASALKMREYGTKIGVTLLALWLGLFPFLGQVIDGDPLTSAIRLGIDLAGGTNLIYQVDKEKTKELDKELDRATMDRMVGAITKRINPSGTEEVTVRTVGADRIEVIVPGADKDKTERIKRRLTRLGSLEFAIAANPELHSGIIDQGQRLAANARDLKDGEGRTIAMWRPVQVGREGEINLNSRYMVSRVQGEGDDARLEVLLVVNPNDSKRLTGRLLKRAYETTGNGGPVVGFTFNERGGLIMQQLTQQYVTEDSAGYKNRLVILLDDEIYSAPTINGVIGDNGQIAGDFDRDELNELIGVLNAGALEVPLVREPVSEFTVSPLLGIDVQQKGKLAIGIAAAAVFVFMLVFYRTAGVIADICLLINIVLVLGVMSLIDATFTLPGLAGLVLTIGMAVDANVLIFERMREERDKGSSLRLAIQQGFSKAFSTIVDANVTTLIVATVLYFIGSDQVRGFAVTLFIGIVMSMFTSLYVGRMIFEILEKKRIIKNLSFGSVVKKDTKVNFLGGRGLARIVSIVLIVAGLGAFFSRGQDNLDIDFRGGTMVTFPFVGDVPTVDEARAALEPNFPGGFSLEQLAVPNDAGEVQTLYRVRTPETDEKAVAAAVAKSFADGKFQLPRQKATFGDVSLEETGLSTTMTVDIPITPALAQSVIADALRGVNETTYEDADTFVTVTSENNERASELAVTTTPDVKSDDLFKAFNAISEDYAASPDFDEVNSFDSAVASETQQYAIAAMLISLVAIVGYIWIRFQSITFGLSAVAALVHDVLVCLGMVAIAGYLSGTPVGSALLLYDFKINLPMIAAFLTIVGYSLNDTIVVFDRIREVRGKRPTLDDDIVNTSLNGTLSRTLLTSLTTLIVVLILYVLGGEGIHGFAFCLVLGVLVGTYSSIYVASPVLLWLMERERKAAEARKNRLTGGTVAAT